MNSWFEFVWMMNHCLVDWFCFLDHQFVKVGLEAGLLGQEMLLYTVPVNLHLQGVLLPIDSQVISICHGTLKIHEDQRNNHLVFQRENYQILLFTKCY